MADISKFKDLQGTTYDLKDTTARGMVSANPTLAGTESELTSIKIGENKYKIASGTIRPGNATTVNGLLKGNGSTISAFTQYLPAEPKTSAEYAAMVDAGTVDPTVAYVITDDEVAPIDVVSKADKTDLASIRAVSPTNATGSTISAGTYFYLDNVLVKALADIASGATFTNNTNYSAVTAGGLNDLKSAFSTVYEATVDSKLSGTAVYSTCGKVVIGCATVTTTANIAAYTSIISGLPFPYGTTPYMGVLVTSDGGYNQFFVGDSGTIINRNALSSGTLWRILFVYMRN